MRVDSEKALDAFKTIFSLFCLGLLLGAGVYLAVDAWKHDTFGERRYWKEVRCYHRDAPEPLRTSIYELVPSNPFDRDLLGAIDISVVISWDHFVPWYYVGVARRLPFGSYLLPKRHIRAFVTGSDDREYANLVGRPIVLEIGECVDTPRMFSSGRIYGVFLKNTSNGIPLFYQPQRPRHSPAVGEFG